MAQFLQEDAKAVNAMTPGEKNKKSTYKWIKIAGLMSFLPFVLAAGPFAGYLLGSYIKERYNAPQYVLLIIISIGFAGSVVETVKLVKFALKTENGN